MYNYFYTKNIQFLKILQKREFNQNELKRINFITKFFRYEPTQIFERTRSEYKRYPVPALVVNSENSHGICGGLGPLGDGGVVEVPLLGVPLPVRVPHVLSQNHVV